MKMADVTVGMKLRDLDDYYFAQSGVLTVTEITPRGFKYDAERGYSLGARHGFVEAKGREHFGVDGECRYVPFLSDGDPMTQPQKPDCEPFLSQAAKLVQGAAAAFIEPATEEDVDGVVAEIAQALAQTYANGKADYVPAAVEAPPSKAEATYQQPVEKMVTEMAEELADESSGYSLQERIAQWREQAKCGSDELTMGGMYNSGRAFAFGRCADEAELIVKRAIQSAVEAPPDAAPQKCVIGEYCRSHGFIHGAEAEELRQRIETMLSEVDHEGDDAFEALVQALQFTLDEVDARDSLAFVSTPQGIVPAPVAVSPKT